MNVCEKNWLLRIFLSIFFFLRNSYGTRIGNFFRNSVHFKTLYTILFEFFCTVIIVRKIERKKNKCFWISKFRVDIFFHSTDRKSVIFWAFLLKAVRTDWFVRIYRSITKPGRKWEENKTEENKTLRLPIPPFTTFILVPLFHLFLFSSFPSCSPSLARARARDFAQVIYIT